MDTDGRSEDEAPRPERRGDMGQASLEESFEAGKGPSESAQGPKKVPVEKQGR